MYCKINVFYRFLSIVFLLIVPCWLQESIYAQSDVQALRIGDKVPEVMINKLMNYPGEQLRLSELEGKVTIIDFWGTTCSSCIGALPKLQQMQDQFPNQVRVLTVTQYDEAEKVAKTFERFRDLKDFSLPVVLDGNQLGALFPHEIISHVVWINQQGTVVAYTGTDYVTADNIRLVLNGVIPDWPVKQDFFSYDYAKPLLSLTQPNPYSAPSVYYSSFTGYIEGVSATNRRIVDSGNNTITWNRFNASLLSYCAASLRETSVFGGNIDPKKLILEVKNKERFIFSGPFYRDWQAKNTFSYSVTLPLTLSEKEARSFIHQDLKRWLALLGISVTKQMDSINVLVLKKIPGQQQKLHTKGGAAFFGLYEEGPEKKLTNSPFSYFTAHLNNQVQHIPWVIDETGIDPDLKVDMLINVGSLQDVEGLRQAIKKYGLDLQLTKRIMEVYVIKEK
jgi:thiol-disulfide isomerase/thioredoxin